MRLFFTVFGLLVVGCGQVTETTSPACDGSARAAVCGSYWSGYHYGVVTAECPAPPMRDVSSCSGTDRMACAAPSLQDAETCVVFEHDGVTCCP